jgi:hypothetical protein
MTTAVAKQEAMTPALVADTPAETVLKSDVVLPKLLLTQALSEVVVDKEKSPDGKTLESGQIIRSTTKEIVGDSDKPVEIVPLTFTNQWMLQEMVGKQYEFRGYEPRTAKNEDLPWEFTDKGTQWRRVKVLTLFALLPADVTAEQANIERFKKDPSQGFDMDKVLLPVAISFRNTSFAAGRTVATHFAKAQQMAKFGVKPYSGSLMLTCKQEKNDKGAYYVFGVEPGKRVAPELYTKATEWASTLGSTAVKVDDSDVSVEKETGHSGF